MSGGFFLEDAFDPLEHAASPTYGPTVISHKKRRRSEPGIDEHPVRIKKRKVETRKREVNPRWSHEAQGRGIATTANQKKKKRASSGNAVDARAKSSTRHGTGKARNKKARDEIRERKKPSGTSEPLQSIFFSALDDQAPMVTQSADQDHQEPVEESKKERKPKVEKESAVVVSDVSTCGDPWRQLNRKQLRRALGISGKRGSTDIGIHPSWVAKRRQQQLLTQHMKRNHLVVIGRQRRRRGKRVSLV